MQAWEHAENEKGLSLLEFLQLSARDLFGSEVKLPAGFTGRPSLVVIAFRRQHQSLVDEWIAWGETAADQFPEMRSYELPVIATRWSPARGLIDGGMAQAVRDPEVRRRTLTVYTDVRRVTDALDIHRTDTVTAMLVDESGRVRARVTGPADPSAIEDLLGQLAHDPPSAAGAGPAEVETFSFEFDHQFRRLLALAGITPGTAHLTLAPTRLAIRFGPWSCETPIANVTETCVTGPYRWYRAIGPRGSFADLGVTFGTSTKGGVCVLLREPVRGLLPVGVVRHPGITVTVAEPERFVASLRRRAGLD